jgi:hypothetical protein
VESWERREELGFTIEIPSDWREGPGATLAVIEQIFKMGSVT